MRYVSASDLARYRETGKPGQLEYVFGEWRKVPEAPEVTEEVPVVVKPRPVRRGYRRGGFRPGMLSQNGNW